MKIRKKRKVFTASIVLGYVPEMLEPNADVSKLCTCRNPKLRHEPGSKRKHVEKKPRDEEVRWVCIGGWYVPYMWFASYSAWYRATDCLYWETPEIHMYTPATIIPVNFSSERTASSPPLLGEDENQ